MERPSLESIYMNFALQLAARSTCLRLKVGCVITSRDLERVLGIGYNGTAKGFPHECREEEAGNCGDIHAEINALTKAGAHEKDKVLFITNAPCETCAKTIVNSGFTKVFYRGPYRSELGFEILKKAGIELAMI